VLLLLVVSLAIFISSLMGRPLPVPMG